MENVTFIYKKATVEDAVALRVAMQEVDVKLGGLDFIINSVGILNEQNPSKTISINYVSELIELEIFFNKKKTHLIGWRCKFYINWSGSTAKG